MRGREAVAGGGLEQVIYVVDRQNVFGAGGDSFERVYAINPAGTTTTVCTSLITLHLHLPFL